MDLTDENNLYPRDKNQELPRAWKLPPIGDSVKSCLEEIPHPPTPPALRKYRSSNRPEPEAITVAPWKANDPDVASALVHGIRTKSSLPVSDLIAPPKKTDLKQKLEELSESIYASNRKAPLGRTPVTDLPAWYSEKTTFGLKTVKGQDARQLINPPKTTEELEKEALEGHEAYIQSHNSYFPGEQIDRKYESNNFNKKSCFGIPTPHFSDGRNLCKALRGLDSCRINFPNPSWKRAGTKEKLALQLGQTTNIRKNTLTLPSEFRLGIVTPSHPCGAGDFIYCTEPGEFVKGLDVQRGLVSALRHRLKIANLQNFPSLLKAFRYYDKKGQGLIDKEDLQAVCHEFNLEISDKVLDDLMEYCDTDKDGFINFVEFANFLNWKNRMPISECRSYSAAVNVGRKPSSEPQQPLFPQDLIRPEDLEPIEPGSSQKTVRTLRRPKASSDHFSTAASEIGAYIDVPPKLNGRTYGIPSGRFDIPAPRIKRINDRINYSDLSTAADVIFPPVYAQWGVQKEDFFCPRTKKEIHQIFMNIGANISEETFEEAWKLAALKHPHGEVCVDVFHNTLKEIKAL
ncbi:EF-hand domain-containing family member B [Cyprinodon tularosa]|uniref:EF-hand domain-containing family member B n=1 Tax=Cyprinodon tularosa TaxID=77115 RepID=UPI0018E2360F|nr:EF-hand domain-containing family member B [Cyprinodon tularosa]